MVYKNATIVHFLFDSFYFFVYNHSTMKKYLYTYENYIFDLYGTLINILTDEESDSFWRKIGKILHIDALTAKNEYKSQCAEKSKAVGESGEFDLSEVFQYLVDKYPCGLDKDELAWKFRKASIKRERLFPHVKSRLSDLRKQGKGVYLISNAQECFTLKELKKLGLINCFDGIVISSEIGYKKPSVDIFERALERFGLNKDGCLFIGNDPVDDIQGAENAGLQSHFVSYRS